MRRRKSTRIMVMMMLIKNVQAKCWTKRSPKTESTSRRDLFDSLGREESKSVCVIIIIIVKLIDILIMTMIITILITTLIKSCIIIIAGQGHFGKVYTAINNETGDIMAMKEIPLQPNDHKTLK